MTQELILLFMKANMFSSVVHMCVQNLLTNVTYGIKLLAPTNSF